MTMGCIARMMMMMTIHNKNNPLFVVLRNSFQKVYSIIDVQFRVYVNKIKVNFAGF